MRHALWLVPAPPARDFLQRTIRDLAARYSAPVFEPHLTLGVSEGEPQIPKDIAVGLIKLRVLGISWSSGFTKTLFVRFDSAPALDDLRVSLGLTGQEFDPHVSLLYQNLREAEKSELAGAIRLPFSAAIFDRLQVIRFSDPVETPPDVEMWELIGRWPLH